ncbi:polysaccharide biosynthesis protein [Thermocrinis albus DSM 14484]|uniref:Polysaccharide biosynthesis protein n=1 Tax=Thermocrinis albus (strain DSM 14484 / JCM 11386 / HI 11/12) TaxID=638303 RepID=D3SNN9_THEAH|nr:flippase [Thermocrinis albus]ADC88776.1 polysaccharide biosynthesis protein [Thermocrinis albus DSM 14484]
MKGFKVPLLEKEKRVLLENFLSLSVLQAVNYLAPLITLPYLVRVLGPDKFGLIAFSQAFIGYFMVLTDYGFNLSATREISINRDNKEKVSEIFNSVMIIKLGLLVLALLLMTVIVFSFEKFRKDWIVYYLTFGMVVGQVLFPTWFFQGMERMKYITFLNILAKLIFTGAIFVFVREQAHYIYVPLINSLGFIISGILALWIVFKDFGVKIMLPSWEAVKRELRDGFPLFLSTASIPLFNDTNIFILGLFADNTTVAIYTLAARIIGALIATQVPIVNSIFPWMSRELELNPSNALKKLRKIRNAGVIVYLIALSTIGILSNWLIPFIFGEEFKPSIFPLLIMLYVPLICYIANIYGNQILINLKKSELFSISLILTGILNIIIIIPLVLLFKENGAAISRLISESFLMLMLYGFSKRELRKIDETLSL